MKIEWKKCRMEKQKKKTVHFCMEMKCVHWIGEWKNFSSSSIRIIIIIVIISWFMVNTYDSKFESIYVIYMWMCVFVDVDEDNKSARYKIECRDTASEREKNTHTQSVSEKVTREREIFLFQNLKRPRKWLVQ